MISVFTDKESNLSFKMNIEGNKSLPEARFVINLPNMSLSIKGSIEEGVITAKVPPLKYVLKDIKEAVLNAHLEVIADNTLFVPWKSEIDLRESIVVRPESSVIVESQTPEVSVKVEESTPITLKKKVTAPPTFTEKEAEAYLATIEELFQIVSIKPPKEVPDALRKLLKESVQKKNTAEDSKDQKTYEYYNGRSFALMEAFKEVR